MYNNNYEEYIRTILGYPNTPELQENQMYSNGYYTMSQTNSKTNLESFYPEIYKIIYPMVKKACEKNIRNTEEDIEKMTDEIYMSVEDNHQIDLNIRLGNTISATNINKMQNKNETHKEEIQKRNNEKQSSESRNVEMQTKRNPANNYLRDLIKILLIREIVDRPNNQMPPQYNPPRPLQNSTQLPMRPPIMPRNYQTIYDIYEY